MTASDQAVEVAVDRFAGPVALGAGEIRSRAAVERGHRQHLHGREAVEVSAPRSSEEVLEPVPVFAPQGDEVFRSHRAKIT